jgi:hypothetical protein
MPHSVNKEHGGAAILVAGSLVMLMGFAAVAIDLSAGFNERRQGQTAADLGALAGAVEYVSVDQEGTLYEVLNITRENLRRKFGVTSDPDDGVWIALWEGCTDPDRPSGFNPWPLSATMITNGWTGTGFTGNAIQCISADADEIRVKLPDQLVDTTFGGVIGANEIATNAVAHARVKFTIDGGARPFGVLASAATGSLCLTTRSGSFPPCNGPDSGNFGTLNSQQWGDDEWATTTDCGLPGNPELAVNVALGTDHIIGVLQPWYGATFDLSAGDPYPSGLARDDNCTVLGDGTVAHSDNSPAVGPSNSLRADTGFNQFAATKAGLISDTDWTWENVTTAPTPLLQQISGAGVVSTRLLKEKVGGTTYLYDVDNTPLWEHLRPDDDLPPTLKMVCAKSTIEGSSDRVAAMNLCLTSYETLKIATPPTTHLFEDTIWENPRFVFVPQFHSVTWGSGSHWQPIKGFRVAYVDTLWFNCNGSFNNTKNTDVCDGSKGLTFAPDILNDGVNLCAGPSAPANCSPLRLDQFTAYLFPMSPPVSEAVLAKFPGQLRGPFEVQLTR